MRQALVVIDVQKGMFSMPEMQPFDGDATVERIRSVLDRARGSGIPVIIIQHDGEPGHLLAKGEPGFAYHDLLTPLDGETVVVKRHCNAFQETGLAAYLETEGFTELTVCGMQTQYCVDTFVRAAIERGIGVRLIADGHTTFGTPVLSAEAIIAHHNHVLGGSFATLEVAAKIGFESG